MASGDFNILLNTPIDLTTHSGGDASPNEDIVTFFVKAGFTSASTLSIIFGAPGSIKDNAGFTAMAQNKPQPASTLGLASILEVQNAQADLLGRDRFASVTDQDKLAAAAAEKTWVIPTNEWQFLSIPKRLFFMNGSFSFSSVGIVRLSFRRVNREETCFSDLLMLGGGVDHSGVPSTAQGTSDSASSGLQGTYKYRLTFKNSTTGNRSNPTSATQVAKNVNRAGVTLSSIPVSADPQVDFVEIFRTVGGGSEFFKIGEVANGTTTFVDEVADHDSLDSTPGVAVMTDEALQFDNAVPDSDFDHHVILKLRAFWISNLSGKEGRLFFSPTGRPEGQAGFIEVSKVGDPLHRLAVLNGILYVYAEARVYRIDEDSAGFLYSKEIGGVPGVQFAQRRTVVPTPRGIFWQATDGIRSFDGTRSVLVNPDPIQKVFRGETAEGIPAFEGTVAAFARGEYLVSNGTRTLAVSLADVSWRDVGLNDVTSYFYEYDTDKIVAGRTSNTQLVEEEGVFTDAAASIPIEWETPSVDGPNDAVVIVERVFIDMDPNSNSITPTLINRFDSVTLTAQSGAGRRTFEDEVQLMMLKPSVRLTGNVTSRVSVFDVELEVRNLSLGITIEGGTRVEVTGRYREDVGSGQIVFEIKPDQGATAPLDQLGRLFVIDRLGIEANTASTSVTPTLVLANTTLALTAINTSTRVFTEFEIDRVGQLQELRLAGNFTASGTRPSVFRAELFVRELQLGVNIDLNRGELTRRPVSGRSFDPTTVINFEIPPGLRTFDDAGAAFIIDRATFDFNTDSATVTPSILRKSGGAITLIGVSTASRKHVTEQIDRMGTIIQMDLAGDFITNAIEPFGVELYLRPFILGLNITSNEQRVPVVGRCNDPEDGVTFEIQPLRHEVIELNNLFWVERVVVEANTNSLDLDLDYTDGLGNTITIGTVNTSSRGYTEFSIERPGPIRSVNITTDMTQDIEVYGIELMLRPVALTLQDRSGQRAVNVKHDGKMVAQDTAVIFDVDPYRNEVDGELFTPLIEILSIDIDTGGVSVVPIIRTELGTLTFTSFSTTARETLQFSVNRVGNVTSVDLQGDFTTGVALYDVQLQMRSLDVGINVITNAG